MVRTQIQISESQAATLRELAVQRHVSVAEIIRLSIDYYLERADLLARAKAAPGRFSSGSSDVSAEHDRYLADALVDH